MQITAASDSSWHNQLQTKWGVPFDVAIQSVDGAPIASSLPTWFFVHGFNSEPGSLLNLITAVEQQLETLPGYGPFQILTLDWSGGARNLLTVEDVIPRVAEWAANQLRSHEFNGSSLNLVGHSFGSYVADEIAEFLSKVNSMVALDPAEEIPLVGSYDATDSVNFAQHSRWSWSLIDGAELNFNNATTAATAREAFVLEGVGSFDPFTSHREVPAVFANLLNRHYQDFQIAELLDDQPGPWQQDRFNKSGAPVVQGGFEAVINVVNANEPGVVEFYSLDSGHRTRLHTGTQGVDRLVGNEGADMLDGLAGDDVLDGGAGIDVARFTAVRQNYAITSTSGGFTVAGSEGLDTLSNIERLYFVDVNVALDVNGAAGNTAKIIGAAFGPASLANRGYVGDGIRLFDSGKSMNDVAALVVNSVPFQQLAGSTDDVAVVTQLYKNVTGTAPSVAEVNYFLNLLDNGMSHADLLVLAANNELNVQHIDIVGLSQSGIEYV